MTLSDLERPDVRIHLFRRILITVVRSATSLHLQKRYKNASRGLSATAEFLLTYLVPLNPRSIPLVCIILYTKSTRRGAVTVHPLS